MKRRPASAQLPPAVYPSIGIDLLSLKRLREFLKRHPRSFSRLLCGQERKRLRSKPSAFAFARFFAAKEAFFKACGLPGMGLDSFSLIEVRPLPLERFRVQSPLLKKAGGVSAEGCFFSNRRWTGAQVIVWKKIHALASAR